MISTKAELKQYILQDSKAYRRKSISANLLGDDLWKFQLTMRKLDYLTTKRKENLFYLLSYAFYRRKYYYFSVRLGFSIGNYRHIAKGFSIAHYGTIIINETSVIGENCRVHAGVNIGATSGEKKAPAIGNNVYIGPGAKLVGNITVADGVCIGANATVVRSITEPNTTWGGTPAKKISEKSSKKHLSPLLF